MKKWNNPIMEELDINQTAGGAYDITQHDGVIVYTRDEAGNPMPSEQYVRLS